MHYGHTMWDAVLAPKKKKTVSNNSYFSDCYSKMEMWCLTQLSLKKEITNIILH